MNFSWSILIDLGIVSLALLVAALIRARIYFFQKYLIGGFALGSGQAFSIGTSWEKFGFTGGGSVGLTFAAIGFLLGCFGGIFLINQAVRKGWLDSDPVKRRAPSSVSLLHDLCFGCIPAYYRKKSVPKSRKDLERITVVSTMV
jgi:Na+/glutamate symporter